MRFRLNPLPRRSADAAPLRHRLAVFWIVIALLCLPPGLVVAGAIDDVGLSTASVALTSPASVVLLVIIAAHGSLDLGDYARGQDEMLFLAGQEPRAN